MLNQRLVDDFVEWIPLIYVLEVFREHIVIEGTLLDQSIYIDSLREVFLNELFSQHGLMSELHEEVQIIGNQAFYYGYTPSI